ncbi:MAG: undecaprenyldiphospho-muramoylpentapeptide beta-N-acetylglucosaminyltransferase [Deltaproteobacteria bacterium]|nr:undecaprenyldiphospho-muramoylpentapeptide beta-N-acetylglucosaminyltransferase [Deltaproteobacteria bacterium]
MNINMKNLRIVMAGGGTGGHLFPAIAIAESFLEKNPRNSVLFVSTGRAFEKTVLTEHGFRLECITAEGIKGKGIRHQLRALSRLPKGVMEAWRILRKFVPDLVIGVGSYASGPLILAAWILRIPIVLHEQNIQPGITNRILFPLAARVHVSFPNTRFRTRSPKIRLSGNPIRKKILECASRSLSPESGAGICRRLFTVGIIGGSQGAHAINQAVIQALSMLKDHDGYHFIHQTGQSDEGMVRDAYRHYGISGTVRSFFQDMTVCYQQADLMICRSGATTVAEIMAIGKPAIFIPFPHASDNHQVLNAGRLVQSRAAEMILESDLTGSVLAERIQSLASNPEMLSQMAFRARQLGNPFAARTIVDDCYALIE